MTYPRKALIFGVTGQDGSYLAELLLDKGYEVIGVGRRTSTNNTERLGGCLGNPGFKLVEGDVADYISISGIFKEEKWINEVYNLSAQSHVQTSFQQPGATFRINAEGVLNILECIRQYDSGWEKPRFYQASTSEMFGTKYTINLSDEIPFTCGSENIAHQLKVLGIEKFQNELTAFAPQSPYAIAKVAAHHLVKLYRDAYGLFACGGILFNHESPRRGENFVTRKISMYVAKLYHRLQSSFFITDQAMPQPKLKLGNLTAKRDWGYAPDYVEVMWKMLQQEEPDDYVIATGETHSVEDFCREAFAVIGIDDYMSYIEIDPSCVRPAEVPHLLGDARKAREKLDWTPNVTFTELVTIMVESDIEKIRENQRG